MGQVRRINFAAMKFAKLKKCVTPAQKHMKENRNSIVYTALMTQTWATMTRGIGMRQADGSMWSPFVKQLHERVHAEGRYYISLP